MRKRLSIWILCLYVTLPLLAVTQEGNVRTIARKGVPSQPVEGVIIRIQGSHNKVASRTNGDFELILHHLQAGEPFSIASIVKAGYEPAEQELIGRRLPCSEQVPVDILLVNRAQLLQEREEIETKARENVELFYQARMDSLRQLLEEQRISADEMRRQQQRLENQYENFEPLLQAMSNVLARTDYHRMDSLSLLMQQAIENGNPEEAERLLREKGSVEQREQVLLQWGKNIDALQQEVAKNRSEFIRQKKQLEDDCYRMYAACLTRFQNDSAATYIRKRAALDTLNIDYQLQAAQFIQHILADYPAAMHYLERAYRLAQTQYSEESGQMATTCNELGVLCKKRGQLDQAALWLQRSLTIREKKYGKNSPIVAEALNNLGELYHAQKDLKRAMDCHKRALKIREKHFAPNHSAITESQNNIATVYVHQGQLSKAEQLFLAIQTSYAAQSGTPPARVAANYNNLATVYYLQGRLREALPYFEQAAEIYQRVLGETHPLTRMVNANVSTCKQQIK